MPASQDSHPKVGKHTDADRESVFKIDICYKYLR